jgi:short-subunit dehydrogenase
MRLSGKRVVLTGASGGIGRALAHQLAARGCRILLVGRNPEALTVLEDELRQAGHGAEQGLFSVAADVTRESDRSHLADFANSAIGGVDILINLAGAMSFCEFSTEESAVTEQLFRANVLAPMALSRLLIPQMRRQRQGEIVNVGSIFGSIAFAWFTTYSSTKFALRGFSEALRRELAGSGVGVTYIAPRAVRTPFNSERIMAMCKATGTRMDDPEAVAKQIVKALERGERERYLGFPESWFVRINGLFPRLVDRALRQQNELAKGYLAESEGRA